MKQNIMTKTVLLLSVLALTACPSKREEAKVIVPNSNQGQDIPGNNPQNPTIPDQQMNDIFRSFQCEVEGNVQKQRKFLGIRFNSSVNIGRTTSLFTLDARVPTPVDLRRKFLGIDIGKFGVISMEYVPANATKSGTDTIVLKNVGLNGNMRMSQSGFGGQPVKLEALGDGMYLSISCKGTSQFKSGTSHTSKTNLACRGKSVTVNGGTEEIEFLRPLNSLLADEEFEISSVVTGKLDRTQSAITFRANIDQEYAPAIVSTASLKSPATFKTSDGKTEQQSVTSVSVTCNIQ
ncbi:hypothetical protein K2P97_07780 [bacterium]|nr:hypothetical protein [bacterium]